MDDEDEFVDAVDTREGEEDFGISNFRAGDVGDDAGFNDDDFGDFAEQEESDADDEVHEDYDPEVEETARRAEQIRIQDTSRPDQPIDATGKRPIVHHPPVIANERNSSTSLINQKNKFDEKYSTIWRKRTHHQTLSTVTIQNPPTRKNGWIMSAQCHCGSSLAPLFR